MSSTAYFAEIQPDPRLRRCVAWSGALLGLAGIPVLLQLPLDFWIRLLATALWLGTSVHEQRQLRRGWDACRALRFSADGSIALLGRDGNWSPASRKPGSVLLPRAGWIRLQDRHGVVFAELLAGHAGASSDWRRLQVIWRHIGAAT